MLSTLALMAFALYSAWAIGANDEIAPVVSGKSLDIKTAILFASIVGLMGAVFLGENVQRCMGSEITFQSMTTESAIIILFASSTWLTFVSYRGYSVSTTHSTQCYFGIRSNNFQPRWRKLANSCGNYRRLVALSCIRFSGGIRVNKGTPIRQAK